jgi:hypothetical protein
MEHADKSAVLILPAMDRDIPGNPVQELLRVQLVALECRYQHRGSE